jgi:hypothetical protein
MDNKPKHLEFVQDVIKRMAGNSFMLRGWSITLITVVISVAVSTQGLMERASLFIIATILIAIFWLLDAYYLSQERAYRGLYTEISNKKEEEIDFSLDARKYLCGDNGWFSSLFSHIFLVFYLPVFLGLLLVCSKIIGIDIYLK